MTDLWDELLEPDIADRFRAALNDSIENSNYGQTARQIQDEAEDRKFAKDEDRMKAIYGSKFYDDNRAAILNFAVQNEMHDLDLAVREWRGSNEPSAVAETQRAEAADPTADRIRELRSEIDKLGYGYGTDAKRFALKTELDDLTDAQGLATIKAANDPEDRRRDLLNTENAAKVRRNNERTTAISRGYTDKTNRESKDGRNARLEREALDMVQGRTATPEPEVSTPNAEAILEQVTNT